MSSQGQGRMTARRLADELRDRIGDGTYRPGERLPSRSAMTKLHHCSDWTVVSAINILRTEGLVKGLPGSGWFVRGDRPVLRLSRARLSRAERAAGRGALLTDAEAGGWTARSETTVEVRPASPELAEAFGLEPGAELLVRDRIMYADDEPIQIATSWLPRELTRGTPVEEQDTGPGGLYARLEDAGHRLEHFDEVVRVGAATHDEASRLGLTLGAIVIRINRTAHTHTRTVEVNRIVVAGDRCELHYSIAAD